MKIKLTFFFLFFFVWVSTSQALFFERRPVESFALNLFTFPIVGNIPGVQSFYGLGVTLGGIAKTDFAASGFFLRGEANENFDIHGDGGDFGVNILVATDIPISKFIFPNSAKLEDLVSLSLYGGNVKNFALAQRKRGIDSEADDFSYYFFSVNPILEEVKFPYIFLKNN